MYIKTNEQTDKNQKSNQKTVNLPLVKSRRWARGTSTSYRALGCIVILAGIINEAHKY
jgi:hypothetical protein